MLHFDGKTILTSDTERSFVEIGGADPKQIFRDNELGAALAHSIETIADAGRYDLLERIYSTARSFNPSLPRIEDIEIPD